MGQAKLRRINTAPVAESIHVRAKRYLDDAVQIGETFEAMHAGLCEIGFHKIEANKLILERGIRPSETPAADWRLKGEKDLHEGKYDGPRQHAGGDVTDDELAYKCGMASGADIESIGTLYAAKDRIRWLSRRLAKAEALLEANGLSL